MKQAQERAKNMGDRETEKENMHTPPKRQATEIPSAVIVIKVNWLQFDWLNISLCRGHVEAVVAALYLIDVPQSFEKNGTL